MKKFGGVYKKTLPQGVTGIQQAIDVKNVKRQSEKVNSIARGMVKADIIATRIKEMFWFDILLIWFEREEQRCSSFFCAGYRSRTDTDHSVQQILSLSCLPISPIRQSSLLDLNQWPSSYKDATLTNWVKWGDSTPYRTRTYNLHIRSVLLYPIELRGLMLIIL